MQARSVVAMMTLSRRAAVRADVYAHVYAYQARVAPDRSADEMAAYAQQCADDAARRYRPRGISFDEMFGSQW
jgi:hypothetical protein